MAATQQQTANRTQQPNAAPSLLEQVLEQPVGKRFKEIDDALQKRIQAIEDLLPANMKGEGFRLAKRAIMTLNRRADIYGEITPSSFVRCVLEAAEFGLAIDGRFAHAVPFTNKIKDAQGKERKVKEVELIFDYTGIVAVAKRNGVIKDCWARLVCKNDVFKIFEENGVNNYHHEPALAESGPIIGALAVVLLPDGSPRYEWMNMKDLDAIRARSVAWQHGGGPWKTDDGEMRKKTVIRRAMKMYTDDQPQVAKMLEIDDRDYQPKQTQDPRPPVVRDVSDNGHDTPAPKAPEPTAPKAAETDPPDTVADASEVPDDEVSQRAAMELQDAIDAAENAEQTAAVKVRLDAAQEIIGDEIYIALMRMLRAKNKEIGVK